MPNVLVVAEAVHGAIRKASYSALTFGKKAQQTVGGELHVLLAGKGVAGLAKELTAFGATQVWCADHPALEHYLAGRFAQVVAALAKQVNAEVVATAATGIGKDLFPRVAARLGAGMASDVLAMESAKVFKRAMWAGNLIATVEVTTPVKVVTVRPTEFEAAKPGATAGEVKTVAVDVADAKATFVEFNEVKSARPALGDARIIVSGGRGTKGDFKPVEALADALGAAVGASRAACDAGWVPNDYQVGQTGKIVAPELYIAAGISGAIQHLAGMKGSKVIVAINKDPDAPIFQIADYGLVADLFKALPELTDAYKAGK
jgi:electron transfer flavoprotein alpha subunit